VSISLPQREHFSIFFIITSSLLVNGYPYIEQYPCQKKSAIKSMCSLNERENRVKIIIIIKSSTYRATACKCLKIKENRVTIIVT